MTPPRILVAADPVASATLAGQLEALGYDAATAPPADLARRVAELEPDLVLLDAAEAPPLGVPVVLLADDPERFADPFGVVRRSPGPRELRLVVEGVLRRSALERKLRAARGLEAVGRIAGGVAHDFNNLLTIINGYAAAVLGMAPLDPAAKDMVEEIGRAGDRATAMTRQLLDHCRGQLPAPRPLDLNAAVAALAPNFAPAPDLPAVSAAPDEVELILLNMAVGPAAVGTRFAKLGPDAPKLVPGGRAGEYVVLSVAVPGPEPAEFGAAVARAVVKRYRGFVHARPGPGGGTTFEVYFPVAAAARSPQPVLAR